jgi:hypothetical protein
MTGKSKVGNTVTNIIPQGPKSLGSITMAMVINTHIYEYYLIWTKVP